MKNKKGLHGRTTIGFLTGEILGPNHQAVWAGILDAVQARDVNLLCFVGGVLNGPRGFEAQGNMIYDLVHAEIVDGLIVWSGFLNWCIGATEMEQFCRRYAPLPIVSGEQVFQGIPGILTDDYQSMRKAVVHLIEVHGYRRIAFIRGPENNSLAQERYRAYTETLTEYGLIFDSALVPPATLVWEKAEAADRINHLLDNRGLHGFEAVILANDNMALGALEALQQRGVRVPDDVALVGYDNMIQTRATTPPLTTVSPLHYERGWKAVEMVLAMIAGAEVPAQEILSGSLIVRESCGCLSPAVVQAAIGSTIITKREEASSGTRSVNTILPERREQILAEIVQTIGAGEEVRTWGEQVLDAFVAELNGTAQATFLSVLKEVLSQMAVAGRDIEGWQNALSVIRRRLRPALNDQEALQAEDLCQQARVMIGETTKRVEIYQAWQKDEQARILQEIESALITTFEVVGLMDVLAEELVHLGIPGCYLSLYENPLQPTERARLTLAYNEQGRMTVEAQSIFFPSQQLAPEGMLPQERRYSFVVEPLYFRQEQIGFALFEIGPHNGSVYESLRGEISSALQGALLMQKVQEHANELAAAYEEIRILNHQLTDENVRMHAEMDLARRIQTALLPPMVKHLHPDFEIAAIMLPAEEVGGDYYDITLDQKGVLWFGIGDVSGHGVTPGLIMMMAQTAHTTITSNYQASARDIVISINNVLFKNVQGRLGEDHFMTFTTLKYLGGGRFQHAGAHLDFVIYRDQTNTCDLIDTPGTWLDFIPNIADVTWDSEFSIETGDVLVLYTDGLTEAFNPQGDILDIQRFMDIVARHAHKEVELLRDAIIADVMAWCHGNQKDDMSLVVVRRIH